MYAYLAETQSYSPLFLEQHDWGLRSLSLGLKPNSSLGVSIFQLLYQADGAHKILTFIFLLHLGILAPTVNGIHHCEVSLHQYLPFFLEVEMIYPKILHITLT